MDHATRLLSFMPLKQVLAGRDRSSGRPPSQRGRGIPWSDRGRLRLRLRTTRPGPGVLYDDILVGSSRAQPQQWNAVVSRPLIASAALTAGERRPSAPCPSPRRSWPIWSAIRKVTAIESIRRSQSVRLKFPLCVECAWAQIDRFFDVADVIYVNAGATRPADCWLDRLADGGRLILPLTAGKALPPKGQVARHGAVFRIERRGDDYIAQWISAVGVFPCEGSRDAVSEAALDKALQAGGWEKVTRLHRTGDLPEERCWLRAPGWALAYY